jgi:hypothetical protein
MIAFGDEEHSDNESKSFLKIETIIEVKWRASDRFSLNILKTLQNSQHIAEWAET